jgi:uncharacterized membrane protein
LTVGLDLSTQATEHHGQSKFRRGSLEQSKEVRRTHMIYASPTARPFATVLFVLAFIFGELPAYAATFRTFGGEITDIAEDGTILFSTHVRYLDGSISPPFDPFGLRLDPYAYDTFATEFSSDGSIIAGHGATNTSDFYQGWIKYPNGGYTPIGTLGGDRSLVYGMSDDGRYLAGTSYNSHATAQGFRWSQASGMEPVDLLPKSIGATVSGMSANGNAITGTASIVDDSFDPGYVVQDCAGECGPLIAQYSQAIIWTEATGTISLGALRQPPNTVDELGRPPVPYSTYANQISDDGTTAVGYGSPFESWVWRADTGMQSLPGFPNQHGVFFPLDVSGDGSVVVGGVGGSCGINCFAGPGAVIWDAVHGTRLLTEVLVKEYGIPGVPFLEHATFVSADGLTIAGRLARTQGSGSWVVTLPWSPAVPEPWTISQLVLGILLLSAFRRVRAQ